MRDPIAGTGPGSPAARRRALLRLSLLAAVLILAGLWLGWQDPFRSSALLPGCLFHRWTGLHCPGCGGTRALYLAMHGQVLAALASNALACVLLPTLVAVFVLRSAYDLGWRTSPPPRLGGRLSWALVAVFILFFLLRNLPWWPFTTLAPAADPPSSTHR